MSLFAMVPPLLSVYKLLQTRWDSLLEFLGELPRSFVEGLRFLITGHRPRSRDHIPIPALELYWPESWPGGIAFYLVCLIWLGLNVADVLWINACTFGYFGRSDGF